MKRSLKYIAALDVFERAEMREAAVYFEYGLDPNTSLPGEVGLEGAAKILAIRSGTVFRTAGALACRLTGIDAVHRLATGTEFPV